MIQGVYDCPKNRIYSEDCPDTVLSNVGLLVDIGGVGTIHCQMAIKMNSCMLEIRSIYTML